MRFSSVEYAMFNANFGSLQQLLLNKYRNKLAITGR